MVFEMGVEAPLACKYCVATWTWNFKCSFAEVVTLAMPDVSMYGLASEVARNAFQIHFLRIPRKRSRIDKN